MNGIKICSSVCIINTFKIMKFPQLKTVKILSDEEMRNLTGGRKTCKKGCIDGCKSSCKPGNSNVGNPPITLEPSN